MRTALMCLMIGILLASCKEEESEKKFIERSTVADAEGNVYQTVKIGNQWWMAENLKTRKFQDGTSIPLILGTANNAEWAEVNGPACTFAQDSLRGFLYNFDVVQDSRNIAPEGWRIPTDEDWKTLEEYIGMEPSASNSTGWRGDAEGVLLASKNSLGWASGTLFGKDEVGFNAIPAGCRIHDGRRNITGEVAFWWSSTPQSADEAWYRYMDTNEDRVFRHHIYTKYGMSIRCVKE